MFAKFPLPTTNHNMMRKYRLTDAILNGETVMFSPEKYLKIKKIKDVCIVNPYLTDFLVDSMESYIIEKQEFVYNPAEDVIFSPDGNHWYLHDGLWWRPNVFEDEVNDTSIQYKKGTKTKYDTILTLPCFDK